MFKKAVSLKKQFLLLYFEDKRSEELRNVEVKAFTVVGERLFSPLGVTASHTDADVHLWSPVEQAVKGSTPNHLNAEQQPSPLAKMIIKQMTCEKEAENEMQAMRSDDKPEFVRA